MTLLAGTLVVAFGLYLVGLANLILFRPLLAERFLEKFASSAGAHYTEQVLRLIVGFALIIFSTSTWFPTGFLVFGWVIVATTVGLLSIHWRWHHRFAQWAIPFAIRHMKWIAVGAFVLAAFILCGASRFAFS